MWCGSSTKPPITFYFSYAISSPRPHTVTHAPSLPLDRPRRFRGDVVDHAVDAAHLVDDAGRHLAQEFMGKRVVVGGHAVGRGHRAERADVVVGAPVAHD